MIAVWEARAAIFAVPGSRTTIMKGGPLVDGSVVAIGGQGEGRAQERAVVGGDGVDLGQEGGLGGIVEETGAHAVARARRARRVAGPSGEQGGTRRSGWWRNGRIVRVEGDQQPGVEQRRQWVGLVGGNAPVRRFEVGHTSSGSRAARR